MSVYLETQNRLKLLFKEFDNIYVSFSGGKDSGVLLNLCIDYIRQNKLSRKIGVFHLDYEAQYTYTTEYVNKTLAENSDILEVYRCCIPFKVTTCTSMYENHWRPWEYDKKDIWVSELPEKCYTEINFDFYKPNMWDYEFQEKFSQWIHKKNNAKKTVCLVGIRTQESLNRWRAIHSDRNYKNYDGINWTKKMYENVFNAYPIYDWITEDVWVANGKFGWTYNKLYDVYYQAGLTIDQMRVASPFLSTAQDSLKLYRIIEPRTWGKLIGRVNGVNFTGIYGGTTAMGWRAIKLPKGHNWKTYMEFLLSTLPENSATNYKKKLQTSIEFWKTKGGVLSIELIEKLKGLNIPIEVKEITNYKTTKKPVTMDYLDDIDITEFTEIPTYKRMCICIMKNDHLCKYMGFSLTKNETQLRKQAETKYKNI
ncbi:COG3969 Predicted phosphoadenosine phosphosulfate sulfotransferase [uncultured Caudovirales phage]|uniref:COG3969 Predicted phosphoadenosine phosphosulfate sulfotransferase n=1 Tax=uncultured Caudovirales phage TaxID=2100421 RepID=A0A6J5P7J4_9CAUD|nr:COG3969 Predicted phosphoadenosine phosphosulfate sulfotransferase [uncultured Caudovirales phage]CAB4171491.1 COG3969 Predicted phosphoadenosine phosphosulfate sulfotransferase [uncultured Caudovirales phage]CAB4177323.1 COG3969 Predicted phosphoadenosine phosphosulfate sulfotransferase [uncultured Caudovirales phage]CAB4199543.1 COG3969 Predicted phosphoadenosine phosphosulfate sulfotransferase [uncultured Caudovirales phage]CAB4213529.1 COG3969 Predicted phosphoadenosine phosphosulfate su